MSGKASTRIACASWDVHTGELRSFNEQFLEKLDLPYGRALGNPKPFLWSDLCGFSVYFAHPDTQFRVTQSTRHLAEVFNDMRLGRATRHFLNVTLVSPLGRVQVRAKNCGVELTNRRNVESFAMQCGDGALASWRCGGSSTQRKNSCVCWRMRR